MSKPIILVVDDEPDVTELVQHGMAMEGFEVKTAGSHAEMLDIASKHPIDIFVLDVLLPDANGIEIAKEIRRFSDVGIVFLTGQAEEIDTVLGLELGADDYISKPFRIREMRARINSVYRRTQNNSFQFGSTPSPAAKAPEASKPQKSDGIYTFFGWTLDTEAHACFAPDGREMEMTVSEFDLLLALLRSRGRVMSRNQLLDALRGDDWASYDRLIDGLISRIRTKIAEFGEERTIIRTVRGLGYMMASGD